MKGLAEGFSSGFGMAEDFRNNKQRRDLADAAEKRAQETHAQSIETSRIANEAASRTNRLNAEYDSALGAGPAAAGLPARGSLSEESPPDLNTASGAPTAVAARPKLDLGAVNDAALRAGKITPEMWQKGRELDRSQKFQEAMGARVKKFMDLDDDSMANLAKQFSTDDQTFGQAHWVAGGTQGAKPGDPNPRTGKGGYAYVMVGNREPFKLTRAEMAQLGAAYELMAEDPSNYDLAFKTLDLGTSKMRELGKAFREEFSRETAANNAATHMANQDEIARRNADTNAARLGIERDRLEMGKFGQPMHAVGPDGQPTMMVPVMGRNGVSFQAAGLPAGYRMPRSVDGAAVQKLADSLVGSPSGQLLNGKPVLYTPDTAWDAAQNKLYGRQPGAGPDVSGDAAAVLAALKNSKTPEQQAVARGMPARPAESTAAFADMPDAELARYVQAGNVVAKQALAERRAAAAAVPARNARGLDPGY